MAVSRKSFSRRSWSENWSQFVHGLHLLGLCGGGVGFHVEPYCESLPRSFIFFGCFAGRRCGLGVFSTPVHCTQDEVYELITEQTVMSHFEITSKKKRRSRAMDDPWSLAEDFTLVRVEEKGAASIGQLLLNGRISASGLPRPGSTKRRG